MTFYLYETKNDTETVVLTTSTTHIAVNTKRLILLFKNVSPVPKSELSSLRG